MTALLLGTVLAVAALGFVLYPLFAAPRHRADGSREAAGAAAVPVPPLSPERERALAALHEIEFEHATGKLSDGDYERLRAEFAALVESPASNDVAADDIVETFIRAYRARRAVCPVCGPRPEEDALFCSACGRRLGGTCGRCGALAPDAAARFCANCGAPLTG